MQETHQTIQKYLTNKTWTDAQDEEIINALTYAKDAMDQVVSYLYILVNYFEQYVYAVQTSPVFMNPEDVPVNDDVSTSPTQTPAPANREQRRAAAKRQTPLERVQAKK